MKKWILLGLLFVVVVSVFVASLYGEKIVVAAVTTTLSTKYQIDLDYKDVGLSLLGGGVAFDELTVDYAKTAPPIRLASAGELEIGFDFWKSIQGTPELSRVYTNELHLDVSHGEDGSLPLVTAINQLAAGKPASATPAAKPKAAEPVPLPKITLKNSTFVYEPLEKTAKKQHIDLGYTALNFDKDQIQLQDAAIYQEGGKANPLLSLKTVNLLSAIRNLANLTVEANTVSVTIREVSKDQYDLNQILNAWQGAINQIVPPDPSASKKESSTPMAIKAGTIQNLKVQILPQDGKETSAGALNLSIATAEVGNKGDTLTLKTVKIMEAGKDTILVDTLSFAGGNKGFMQLDTIELANAQITIRETADKTINLARAIERIQSVINSLSPQPKGKPETKTASASPMPTVKIRNSKLTWIKPDESGHGIDIKDFTFSAKEQRTLGKDVALFGGLTNPQPILRAPSISVDAMDFGKSRIGKVLVDQLQVHGMWTADGINLSAIIADWSSLPSLLFPTTDAKPVAKAEGPPFRIEDFLLTGTRLELVDSRTAKLLNLVFDPLEFNWTKIQFGGENADPGDFSLVARSLLPSEGSISLKGKAGSFWSPVDCDLDTSIFVKELTSFSQYFGENVPVSFLSTGLNLNGKFKVSKNMLESTFDLLLKNPKFSTEQGKWLGKLDSKSAITALNGMRDESGDILFKNNRLSGNIMDPQFDFGTNLMQIISRNMLSGVQKMINLPIDVAGKGANVLGDGAGSVKNGVGGILNTIIPRKKPANPE